MIPTSARMMASEAFSGRKTKGNQMAQIMILLSVGVLALCGCASAPQRVVPAAELAAQANEAPRASKCAGAQRTPICTRHGSCHCTDSGNLLQSLGLSDVAWAGQSYSR
jgi:hypothetical protein